MCCLAQTPDVLSKAKELLEIVRNTVMIPKNLAGEWVCCVWVGLMCIVEFFHLSSVCCTCICTYNMLGFNICDLERLKCVQSGI